MTNPEQVAVTRTTPLPTNQELAAAVRATPAGELSPEARAMIAERKAHSLMIAQMKGATWAKEMDENTIRAIAAWARQNDIDAATEIDILGGNIYVNSKEAYRRLGELTTAGEITKHGPVDWIHADPRLDKLADAGDGWASAERMRRARLRIQHAVPDESTAAAVYRIWHRALSEPVEGCKWNQKGRRVTIKRKDGGSFEKDADPVGDLFPMESVESRAVRRALLKLRGAVPALKARLRVMQEESVPLADVIEGARERARLQAPAPTKDVAQLDHEDPYAPAERPLSDEVFAELPHLVDDETDSVTVALDVALGEVVNGKRLGDVRNTGLRKIRAWAEGRAQEQGDDDYRMATIIASCDAILDARARGEIQEPSKQEAA